MKPDILSDEALRQLVYRMTPEKSSLQHLFGWGLNGLNTKSYSGSHFHYDTLLQKMKGKYPSVSMYLPLKLMDARGNSDDVVGRVVYMMERMVKAFTQHLEVQTAAMIRGCYSYSEGHDFNEGFSGGNLCIRYPYPPATRGRLDIMGRGPMLTDWNDPEANIPGQLQAISYAMIDRTGRSLTHVILPMANWEPLTRNNRLRHLGSLSDWLVFDKPTGGFQARFLPMPQYLFHVIDYPGHVFGSSQPLIEDDHAAFVSEIHPSWVEYREGSGKVSGRRAHGFDVFASRYQCRAVEDWDLNAILTGTPAVYNPYNIAYGYIGA
jgi:hypothetical protein